MDRQYEKFTGQNPKISPVESISCIDFDYIVIAVEEERVAMEIIDILKGIGISTDKIVWSLSYE